MDPIIKKEQIKEDTELDQWINALYEQDHFFVEFKGRKFEFKSRLPGSLAFELQSLNQGDQIFNAIAVLSEDPKLSVSQAKRLPQDFLEILSKKIIKVINPKSENIDREKKE